MPVKSQAQRAYLYATKGAAWVKEHHFDQKGKLPAHVRKGRSVKKSKTMSHGAHAKTAGLHMEKAMEHVTKAMEHVRSAGKRKRGKSGKARGHDKERGHEVPRGVGAY